MELSQSKETWIHFSQEPMTACGVTLCLQTPQTVAVGWLAPGHLSSREQPAPALPFSREEPHSCSPDFRQRSAQSHMARGARAVPSLSHTISPSLSLIHLSRLCRGSNPEPCAH